MGFSRDTFYRYQAAVAEGGVDALLNANRKKPNPKNRVEEAVPIWMTGWRITTTTALIRADVLRPHTDANVD